VRTVPVKNPVVTVLITVFNGERYLGKAIESVLSQTFSDFEVLVVMTVQPIQRAKSSIHTKMKGYA